jgi:AcrR family transcriptional regulator
VNSEGKAVKDECDRSSKHNSREALMAAAKQVFAEHNYEGATVKDVADLAGVNISLISYHFGGKENLYKECMRSFGLERVETAERILKPAASREEFKFRLQMYGEAFIDIHQREPHICKMIHRASDTLEPITMELFESVFQRIFFALHAFIKAGQESGIVKKHLDSEIASSLAFGSLVHMLKSDPLRRRLGLRTLDEPVFRDSLLEHWVQQISEGTLQSPCDTR